MILLGEVVDQQKEMLMSLHNKLNTMERFYGSQLIWKIDNFAVIIFVFIIFLAYLSLS